MKKKKQNSTELLNLENSLILENNTDEINRIVDIFNLNIQKKNVLRIGKLNEIQDAITQQIEDRVKNKADEFNNTDLLNYFKVIQETISKSNSIEDIKNIPQSISITNNELNLNIQQNTIDNDSRERVIDAVKFILNKSSRDKLSDLNDEKTIIEEIKND